MEANEVKAPELELTEGQKVKSVDAAYDSVILINQLKAKGELSEEDTDALTRNVEHLKIMLAKEWFVETLNAAQKEELEAIVK
jgi:hypothetical protein